MSKKKIVYEIGFNVDSSNLDKVKYELQRITELTDS